MTLLEELRAAENIWIPRLGQATKKVHRCYTKPSETQDVHAVHLLSAAFAA